ncbi:hypothetical protein IQ216_01700 [Cyanobium sp. LEGE 06143]|uniref:hypothetical protein n=1 Tax=Cyanobium sp. LEGE 06143 TaxID=945727 RepID=UPI00187F7942|nr:hypothetical protein [Cyanobium sp. LEGE 06143]
MTLQSCRCQSQAQQMHVTQGNSDGLARYLREVEGVAADPLDGHFSEERGQEESQP